MKQRIVLKPWLKEFHWDHLANLHLDVGYCRHRLIQSVNAKVATNSLSSIEHLEQLAKVDDLLKAAADGLENAKTILFDLCLDFGSSPAAKRESKI